MCLPVPTFMHIHTVMTESLHKITHQEDFELRCLAQGHFEIKARFTPVANAIKKMEPLIIGDSLL